MLRAEMQGQRVHFNLCTVIFKVPNRVLLYPQHGASKDVGQPPRSTAEDTQ